MMGWRNTQSQPGPATQTIVARHRLLVIGLVIVAVFVSIFIFMRATTARAFDSDLTAAKSKYPFITNTKLDSCDLCHVPGSFSMNTYGKAYKDSKEDFAAIEALDSDGDGFSNIDELMALTFPGDPADKPMLPTPTNTPFGPMPTDTPPPTGTDPPPTATPTLPGPEPSETPPTPPTGAPSEGMDLDIKGFKVSKHAKLDKDKPIEIRLDVKNYGSADGEGTATVIGMQNGTEVYNETMSVSDAPGNGHNRYHFPGYMPTKLGDILWVVTLSDDDPDIDEAMAMTRVTGRGADVLDLDIKGFKVSQHVKLGKGKPVEIRLDVKNESSVDGSGTATVIGMQNGVEVYNETLTVSDAPGNGHSRYHFQSYQPDTTGDIEWMVMISDDDPDTDETMGHTRVTAGEKDDDGDDDEEEDMDEDDDEDDDEEDREDDHDEDDEKDKKKEGRIDQFVI